MVKKKLCVAQGCLLGRGVRHWPVVEFAADIEGVDPLAVYAEGAVIAAGFVGRQVEEPAEEHVDGGAFAHRPFGADGVQGHEDLCLEESLGRDAQPTAGGVRGARRCEGPVHLAQTLVGHALVGPERVFGGDQVVEGDLDEQIGLTIRVVSRATIFAPASAAGHLNVVGCRVLQLAVQLRERLGNSRRTV